MEKDQNKKVDSNSKVTDIQKPECVSLTTQFTAQIDTFVKPKPKKPTLISPQKHWTQFYKYGMIRDGYNGWDD